MGTTEQPGASTGGDQGNSPRADENTLRVKKKLSLLQAARQQFQQSLMQSQITVEPIRPRMPLFSRPQVQPEVQMDYDVRDSVYSFDHDTSPADPVTVLDWDLNDPIQHV